MHTYIHTYIHSTYMTRAQFLSIVGLRARAFGAQPEGASLRAFGPKLALGIPKHQVHHPKQDLCTKIIRIPYYMLLSKKMTMWLR